MNHERVQLDGHRLANLRVDQALTQGDLAERASVTSRTIYRAEQGEPISLRTWRSISFALGVPPLTLRAQVSA